MNIQWDAETYTKKFSFVPAYGSALMELIENTGKGERPLSVLDLGCGSGRLTRELAEHGYAVRGMDASAELLDIARRTYPEIPFSLGDATDFSLEEPCDVVFSNAVFHWIDKEKQEDMLSCVHDALVPGGQLVFEMGGHGNNALIHGALREEFERRGFSYTMPFYFPTIGEYAPLLEQAGFLVRTALLFDRPTKLSGPDGMADWIRMFVKTPFTGVPAEVREEIIAGAVETLRPQLVQDGIWMADYVRLRVRAVRAD